MSMTAEDLDAKLKEAFPALSAPKLPVKDYPCYALPSAGELPKVVAWLKDELGFDYLDMVTGVDWHGPVDMAGFISDPNPNPFVTDENRPAPPVLRKSPAAPYREAVELVYCFSNTREKIKVFLSVDVPRDGGSAPTLEGLFKTADWQEREVFDLFGIRFDGHPNLKKILSPEFTEGHPFRKDYIHKKDRFD